MLDTLIRLGQHLSNGRGEWNDIINVPNTTEEQAKGITPLVAQLLFDLDTNQVILDRSKVKAYEPQDAFTYMNVNIQGGNNKAVYATVAPKKSFEQLRKTFFGTTERNGGSSEQGQFKEAIDKEFHFLRSSALYYALSEIFTLSGQFSMQFIDQEKDKTDFQKIATSLGLSRNERVVLLYAAVKSEKLGIHVATPVVKLTGFEDFVRAKFLDKHEPHAQKGTIRSLCYATGVYREDVSEIEFGDRYSINKLFVTTTKNYASGFDDKAFRNNYQASALAQLYLERGSKYLLRNFTTEIAGITHVIIPRFFSKDDVDPDLLLQRISTKTDLLFRYKELSEVLDDFSDKELYWVDFWGFESDGNFFKVINIISDVSSLYFNNLIEGFILTDRAFKNIAGIEWERVMTTGKDFRFSFNLHTLYHIIPVRKKKEKRNTALALFKAILEHRTIEPQRLYSHFCELILCHRFDRHAAYENISPNGLFDFAVRNAVFQYHALFYTLKQFNLLKDMDNILPKELTSELKPTEAFFQKMNYNDCQKAMFYLGRILQSVAYAQQKKGYESKPVLNKVNYNGMDKKAITRLHKDLFDKCRQFSILPFNELLFSNFTRLFNNERWSLKPEEALFYLLAGYSFRES